MFDISLKLWGVVIRSLVLVLRALGRCLEIISTAMERFWHSVAIVLLIGMWGLLLLNAISRWIEHESIAKPVELVGFMLAWTIFVMMGPVAKLDKHIKVTHFSVLLLGEKRGLMFTHIVESAAGLSFSIFMSIHAYRWILWTFHEDKQYDSAFGWGYPLWIIRLGLFLGFTFLSFFYFERIVKLIKSVASQLADRGNK